MGIGGRSEENAKAPKSERREEVSGKEAEAVQGKAGGCDRRVSISME